MADSVRMSDLQDSDNSPTGSVRNLRDRFEKRMEQGVDTKAEKNGPGFRSPSPVRSPTPPGKVARVPPRPPPPRRLLEDPRRHSELYSEPQEQARSVTPGAGSPPYYNQQRDPHPLAKSKSRSVGDLKAINKKELIEPKESVDVAPAPAVTTPSPEKKEKKAKNKTKSKDNVMTDSSPNGSGGGKKFWRKNKSQSTDVSPSPKHSPIANDQRKFSAPMLSKPPHSSPKKEALAPMPESTSSSGSASSSKEGTPTTGRRRSAGRKEVVKKTTSSHTELGSGRENGKQKEALRKSKSTGVTSVYQIPEGRDVISTPRSSPAVEKKRRARDGGGEGELIVEAKRIREAVLNAGLYYVAGELSVGLV